MGWRSLRFGCLQSPRAQRLRPSSVAPFHVATHPFLHFKQVETLAACDRLGQMKLDNADRRPWVSRLAGDPIVLAFRFLLTLTAAISGAILAVRAINGPFHFFVTVGSPLSAETICAVAFIALILSGMDGPSRYAPVSPRWTSKHLGIALLLAAAAFYGITRLYFFGDDFFVVRDAVDLERGREFLRSLVVQTSEIYYRPAGYSLLWVSSLPLA